MKTISATEAKNRLAAVMAQALKAPLIIEKNGQPCVVMMSVEAYEKSNKRNEKEVFIEMCQTLSNKSKRRGMTEEILQSILENTRTSKSSSKSKPRVKK